MNSRHFPGIRAVTFDVGGTLLETWPSVGHLYAEVAAAHGLAGISAAQLDHAFRGAWHRKQAFDYSRTSWLRLVETTFAAWTPTPIAEAFFDQLYQRFAEPSAWRVFDDVRPALDRLEHRGLKLAVISNWDERLRPLLERLELARHFQTLVISSEVGHAKPAREIFAETARRLGIPPRSILHVGDSPDEDKTGAAGAGFQAALLRRGEEAGGEPALARLTELDSMV